MAFLKKVFLADLNKLASVFLMLLFTAAAFVLLGVSIVLMAVELKFNICSGLQTRRHGLANKEESDSN